MTLLSIFREGERERERETDRQTERKKERKKTDQVSKKGRKKNKDGLDGTRQTQTGFLIREFCLPFAQTVDQAIFPCKW